LECHTASAHCFGAQFVKRQTPSWYLVELLGRCMNEFNRQYMFWPCQCLAMLLRWWYIVSLTAVVLEKPFQHLFYNISIFTSYNICQNTDNITFMCPPFPNIFPGKVCILTRTLLELEALYTKHFIFSYKYPFKFQI
jgi:hypothetical protein